MRGILVLLLIAVIGVFGQNYGNAINRFAERLGPEYPQPPHTTLIKESEEVLPRLGAAAVELSGPDSVFLTGGLAFLPNDWPAAFKNIDSLAKQHAVNEVSLYYNPLNKFIDFGINFELKNSRAFHVAVAIDEFSAMIWGGGSSVVEVLNLNSVSPAFEEVAINGVYQPTSTYGASAALEQHAGLVVVFGGQEASGVLSNEVNVYDPYLSEWYKVNLAVGAEQPSGRYGASLSFNSADNTTSSFILYGGVTADGISDEVWEFDLITETWTQLVFNVTNLANLYDAEPIEDDGSATRAFHAVFNFPGVLYIFAGESKGSAKLVIVEIESGFILTVGLSNNQVSSVSSGFASVFSLKTFQVLIFGGIRDSNSFIDTRSLNGEVVAYDVYALSQLIFTFFQRVDCYPGFVFDDVINVCVLPSEASCNMCDKCTDLSLHNKQYLNKLKNKSIQRDHSGILKHCAKSNKH